MALVERIIGELLDDVEQFFAKRPLVSVGVAAIFKRGSRLSHNFARFLAHRLAEVVCFGQRIARKALGDAHHAFLIDHQAECVVEQLLGVWMKVLDWLATVLAVGVVVMHIDAHRAWPVQRQHSRNVLETVRCERLE